MSTTTIFGLFVIIAAIFVLFAHELSEQAKKGWQNLRFRHSVFLMLLTVYALHYAVYLDYAFNYFSYLWALLVAKLTMLAPHNLYVPKIIQCLSLMSLPLVFTGACLLTAKITKKRPYHWWPYCLWGSFLTQCLVLFHPAAYA